MQYMKKSLAAFLAVLMMLSAMSLVSFAADPGLHDHQYNATPDVPAVAATCTTAGHSAGWTCTVEGCGFVKYENGQQTIPALGHQEVVTPAVPATCTKDGKTEGKTCSRCGAVLVEQKTDPAPGHNWSEWKVVLAATTCGQTGEKQRICSRCGEMEYQTFPGADHKPVEVKEVKATCTTNGMTAGKKCSVCGQILEGCEVIKAPGHKYDKGVTVEPTCEKEGKTTYTCTVCKSQYEDNVKPALGHQVVIDEAVPATCQQDGKTEGQHCSRCNKVLKPQELVKGDHIWEEIPPVAPTCTEKGSTEGRKCTVCGKWDPKPTDVDAKGHNFTTEVITPVTCEANGLTKKYCTDCNVSEIIVVLATGHKPSDWIYSENFSCENGGQCWKICENCGEEVERKTLPAAGHKWSKEWTVDTPATCTTKGYQSHHCTVCNAKNDITTIPKIPHKFKDTVTKATFKKSGLVTGVCTLCGAERTPLKVKRVDAKSIKLSKAAYTYDGKAKKPTVVVKDAAGKKLKNGTDFKVTYASGRKKVGTYTVKIKLIGYYSGSKTLKFTINLGTPKGLEAKTSTAKKTIKLNYDAVKGAKKYVIYCSTEKDGSYKKLATTAKTAYTVKTLDPGTYFFKVRALTQNNKSKNAYSAYSNALKVKLAKAK